MIIHSFHITAIEDEVMSEGMYSLPNLRAYTHISSYVNADISALICSQ